MNTENPPPQNHLPEDQSRRLFLHRLSLGLGIFGAALLGAPFLGFLLDPLLRPPIRTWRQIGKVEEFPIGETLQVRWQDPAPLPWAGKVALTSAWLQRRDTETFVAYSVNCQHLGCPVRWLPGAKLFLCPCHGGVYYENGAVAGGPPPRALQEYPIRIVEGYVEIQAGPIPMNYGIQ